MGQFELQGCVTVDGSSSCGRAMIIGRNSSWWEASPWSAGPQIQILPDRQNVTIGGEVQLLVQNPWWGSTSALLVWGNSIKQETRTIAEVRFDCIWVLVPRRTGSVGVQHVMLCGTSSAPCAVYAKCSCFSVLLMQQVYVHLTQVPRGVSTVKISGIGEECRGSCRVMLVLAVARPPAPTAAAAKERAALGILRNILPFTIDITTDPAATTAQAGNDILGQQGGQAAAGTDTIQLPELPTSKLFDPLAPRTVYAEVVLDGPQPEVLSVAVAVQGQSKTADGTAVIAPKVSCVWWISVVLMLQYSGPGLCAAG